MGDHPRTDTEAYLRKRSWAILPVHTIAGFRQIRVERDARAIVPVGGWDVDPLRPNTGPADYVYPDGKVERVVLTIEFPEHPEGG